MGGSVGKIAGQVARGGLAVFSGGISEGVNAASKGKLYQKTGMSGGPIGAVTGAIGRTFGLQNPDGSPGSPSAGFTDDPKSTLAITGGAPLLANVAMGASVEDSIAGYFGAGDYKSFYANLSDDDKQLVDGVKNQLTEIQTNSNLRNQAVQQVVNDFPNIAAQAAQAQKDAKSNAGEEFDSTTKGYIDQAINGVAAKYAAGGNLSSGAAAAASARAGASMGEDKLSYMTGEGDKAYGNSYNAGLGAWQARYNEANALRSFQNTMTQGAAGNGFSAVQSMLGRTQQTKLTNAGFANSQSLQSQANDNAMFGAVGGLVGTVAGAAIAGPSGAMVGSQMGKMAAPPTSAPSTQSGQPQFSNYA